MDFFGTYSLRCLIGLDNVGESCLRFSSHDVVIRPLEALLISGCFLPRVISRAPTMTVTGSYLDELLVGEIRFRKANRSDRPVVENR